MTLRDGKERIYEVSRTLLEYYGLTSVNKFTSDTLTLYNGDTFSIYATVDSSSLKTGRRFLENSLVSCVGNNCGSTIVLIISWGKWLSQIDYKNTITSSESTIYSIDSNSSIKLNVKLPILPVLDIKEYSILKELHHVDIFNAKDPLFNDVCKNINAVTEEDNKINIDGGLDSDNKNIDKKQYQVEPDKDISLTYIKNKFNTKISCSSGCKYVGFSSDDFILCECTVYDKIENLQIYYETETINRLESSAYNGSKAFTCFSAGFNSNTIFLNIGFITFLIIITTSLVVLFVYLKFPKYEVLNHLKDLAYFDGFGGDSSTKGISGKDLELVKLGDAESKFTEDQHGKQMPISTVNHDVGTNFEENENKLMSSTKRDVAQVKNDDNEPEEKIIPIRRHTEKITDVNAHVKALQKASAEVKSSGNKLKRSITLQELPPNNEASSMDNASENSNSTGNNPIREEDEDEQPQTAKSEFESNTITVKNDNETINRDNESKNQSSHVDFPQTRKDRFMDGYEKAKMTSTDHLACLINDYSSHIFALRNLKLLPIEERLKSDSRSFCVFIKDELKIGHFFISVFFRKSVIRPFPIRFLIFLLDISFFSIYCILLISDNTIDGLSEDTIYLTTPLLSLLYTFVTVNILSVIFLCSERKQSEKLASSLFSSEKKAVTSE